MECPCTDQWEKVFSEFSTLSAGFCKPAIAKADDCYTAAQELGLRPEKRNSTVSNPKLPAGCSVSATVGGYDVVFNTDAGSNVTCGQPAADAKKTEPRVAGLAENLVNISVDLNPASDLATIQLQGPANVWFGVGLGAHGKFNPADPSSGLSMLGTNWTIIVLTDGTVMERDLGNHEPGTELPPSVTVVSNTVVNGQRTIIMTRSIAGSKADNMRFDPKDNSMPFINAIGNDHVFDLYGHKLKATGVICKHQDATGLAHCRRSAVCPASPTPAFIGKVHAMPDVCPACAGPSHPLPRSPMRLCGIASRHRRFCGDRVPDLPLRLCHRPGYTRRLRLGRAAVPAPAARHYARRSSLPGASALDRIWASSARDVVLAALLFLSI